LFAVATRLTLSDSTKGWLLATDSSNGVELDVEAVASVNSGHFHLSLEFEDHPEDIFDEQVVKMLEGCVRT
jgi:hypothetical protein